MSFVVQKLHELTVVNYENDIKTVENLIKTVIENRKIAHSFYAAKAKIIWVSKTQIPNVHSKEKENIGFEES